MFDYSLAQLGGHEEAFADALIKVFGAMWNTLDHAAQSTQRQTYLEQAREYQKGCTTHFYRSVTRIKQDGSLVPPDKRDHFQGLIDDFLSPDVTRHEFDGAVAAFRKEFPALKNWIDWWLRPKIAGMIFPACRTMNSELVAALPNTSNPVETQHSLLHHSTGTAREITKGIEELYLHVVELKLQYDAIQGMVLAEQDIVHSFLLYSFIAGHFKASNRIDTGRRKLRKQDYVNDGRAPDTADALHDSHESTESSDNTPEDGFLMRASDHIICVNGEFTNTISSSVRQLYSYNYYKNSCFLDCGLELLFRAYVLWPPRVRRDILIAGEHNLLQSLFWQFHRRFDWIAAPEAKHTSTNKKSLRKKTELAANSKRSRLPAVSNADKTDLSRILVSSQSVVRQQVYGIWKLYPQDTYGDVVHWLEKLFTVREISQ